MPWWARVRRTLIGKWCVNPHYVVAELDALVRLSSGNRFWPLQGRSWRVQTFMAVSVLGVRYLVLARREVQMDHYYGVEVAAMSFLRYQAIGFRCGHE